MALSKLEQTRIRDYLLGHLNEEEQKKIEERLMLEDDLFEELEISKGELVEEYRAGELDRKDKHWFESHYLASPEGKQSYTFAVALNCLEQPSPRPKPLTWFQRFLLSFKQKPWALAAVAFVAVAITLGLIASQVYGPKQTTLAISLDPSAINRGPSETKYRRIQLTPDVGEVKIELMLRDSPAAGANYRVEFDNRSGKTKDLNVSVNDARSISVVITAAELSPGLYALRLFATNANAAELRVGDYFFEVTN